MENKIDSICQICKIQCSNYRCPKCGIPSCSLVCYKQHNQNCLNQFHHESLTQMLKNEKVGEEERKKMLEILKRIEEEDDKGMEEEDFGDKIEEEVFEKILKLNLLENEDEMHKIYSLLTEKQKNEFKELLKKNNPKLFFLRMLKVSSVTTKVKP